MTASYTGTLVATRRPQSPRGIAHDHTLATWERIWARRPSGVKDNALLERERRSTRWSMVVRAIQVAFGSLGDVRTIELGCGRGDLSALLAQEGARVTLLDASEMALSQAAERFHRLGLAGQYERADMLEPLAAHRDRFDVAVSSGVIEHFRGADRVRVVRAHYEVLRPGGLAVISVPNAWCVPYRFWKAYLERRGWWPYGMEIPYTKRELAGMAQRAGLEKVELACYGFWQSLGSQVCKTFTRWSPDWYERPSRLDPSMGLILMLFARRPPSPAARVPTKPGPCGAPEMDAAPGIVAPNVLAVTETTGCQVAGQERGERLENRRARNAECTTDERPVLRTSLLA